MTYPEMFPIELTVSMISSSASIYKYIWYVFVILCKYEDLLKGPDYERLYDEAIDYLFRYGVLCDACDINNREHSYLIIRMLVETCYSEETENNKPKLSMKIIDQLLEERRKIWMM